MIELQASINQLQGKKSNNVANYILLNNAGSSKLISLIVCTVWGGLTDNKVTASPAAIVSPN